MDETLEKRTFRKGSLFRSGAKIGKANCNFIPRRSWKKDIAGRSMKKGDGREKEKSKEG